MADLEAFYRIHLKAELVLRKGRNRRYSLRAFAASLKVHNAFLSRLLAGKALLSLDVADAMAQRLKLTGETRARFLTSAIDEQKCHALYLLDDGLTDCDPATPEVNASPRPRRR